MSRAAAQHREGLCRGRRSLHQPFLPGRELRWASPTVPLRSAPQGEPCLEANARWGDAKPLPPLASHWPTCPDTLPCVSPRGRTDHQAREGYQQELS